MDTIYLSNVFSDRYVAAVTPSSSRVCDAVLKYILFEPGQTIVEYGAGEGAVTEALLKRMYSDSKLYAFETNSVLAEALENKINDPRLEILVEDAAKAGAVLERKGIRADVIVSGVPMSLFPADKSQSIIEESVLTLEPDGLFIAYQTWLPPFLTARAFRRAIFPYFTEIGTDEVYGNIPPIRVIAAKPRALAIL